jgi:hypothetical protein
MTDEVSRPFSPFGLRFFVRRDVMARTVNPFRCSGVGRDSESLSTAESALGRVSFRSRGASALSNFRCSIWLLPVLLAGTSLILYGQPVLPAKVNCIAPEQPQTMLLTFVVQNLAVNGKSGLHWRIQPLPAPDDIQVTDPALKAAIVDWINNQNKLGSDPKNAWVMDGLSDRTFFNGGLTKGISAVFTINPYPAIAPPAAESPGASRKSVTFCAAPAPGLHFDMVAIEIVSAKYDPAKPTPPQSLTASLGKGVTASALFSAQETTGNRTAVLEAFATVAEAAAKILDQNKITIGADVKSADLRKVETSITALYNMVQNNIPFEFWHTWPEANAIFQKNANGKCCTLRVREVQMAKRATIGVVANLGDVGAKTISPEQQARADNLAKRTEQTLQSRFAGALAAIRNTVPTFAQLDDLRRKIAAAPEIYPTVRLGLLEGDDQTIVFGADNRWTKYLVNLTAAGGYSVEDKGTGKLTFQGENLTTGIRDGLPPFETESATYAGGGEVQKANANWALNWPRNGSGGAQTNFGPQISGDFVEDQDQRFGNTVGPVLRDHEIGWEPSFAYSYTSAELKPDQTPVSNLFGLAAGFGIRQRWFSISPATGSLFPPRASGYITAVFVDATPSYRYQPVRAGPIGGLELGATIHFLQGLPAGDYEFTQIQGSAWAALYFGSPLHPRDYFVRFRKGMGSSNGATPLFELFRLGGSDTRGIEQGEQVGREIAFEQSEAGVSARQIVSWFQHAPKTPTEKMPTASPIDLTKIYLAGFYDRGRVFSSGSFSDLVDFRHAAKGYGIAVELAGISAGKKRITLSIGYAWSPDSVLHHNGVPITNASIVF